LLENAHCCCPGTACLAQATPVAHQRRCACKQTANRGRHSFTRAGGTARPEEAAAARGPHERDARGRGDVVQRVVADGDRAAEQRDDAAQPGQLARQVAQVAQHADQRHLLRGPTAVCHATSRSCTPACLVSPTHASKPRRPQLLCALSLTRHAWPRSCPPAGHMRASSCMPSPCPITQSQDRARQQAGLAPTRAAPCCQVCHAAAPSASTSSSQAQYTVLLGAVSTVDCNMPPREADAPMHRRLKACATSQAPGRCPPRPAGAGAARAPAAPSWSGTSSSGTRCPGRRRGPGTCWPRTGTGTWPARSRSWTRAARARRCPAPARSAPALGRRTLQALPRKPAGSGT